ncbi:MAG: hypothetical protein ACE361_18835 [Aureliella sp.]
MSAFNNDSDNDAIEIFEQELRALNPRPANFELEVEEKHGNVLRSDLNQADNIASPIVVPTVKSNWSTIIASWSAGAAAGILGTLISLSFLTTHKAVESARSRAQDLDITAGDNGNTVNPTSDDQNLGTNLASSTVRNPGSGALYATDRNSFLGLGGLMANSNTVLTPRNASMSVFTPTDLATARRYSFNSVGLASPIRAETDNHIEARNSLMPSTDAMNSDIPDSPNQRQLLRNMLDPFAST